MLRLLPFVTVFLLLGCGDRLLAPDAAPAEAAFQLSTSSGTTYYVDPAGSDDHDGLATERAWRTVAKVNEITFVPGDRVLFRGGGVWREMLEPRGNGSAEAPITFGAFGEGRPILDGQGATGYAGIAVGPRQHVLFRGFEVRNRPTGNLVYLAGARDIVFDDLYVHTATRGFHGTPTSPTSDIQILNSRIENTHTGAGGIAINVTDGSTRWTVRRTVISRAGDSCIIDTGSNSLYEQITVSDCGFSTMAVGTHGLYLKGPGHALLDSDVQNTRDSCVSVRFPGIRVQGNRLHGCAVGVSWFEGTGGAGVVTVTRNTIWNAHTGIYVDGSATQTFHFSHNTIVGLRAGGEQDSRGIWVHPVPALFIENNVVAGVVDVPLHVRGTVPTYVERANVFHSSLAARFHWADRFMTHEEYRTASGQSEGSTTVDPMLVNISLEAPDFRLQPATPVLGIGVLDPATGALVRGCSGAPDEYCGAGPEPGAYEVLGGNAPRFTGFFRPVENLPTLNRARAGSAIPVKFSLDGYHGLDIFAPGFPRPGTIACDAPASATVDQTVTAGGSSLSYDAEADQYTYVWKTDRAWANSCRQLVLQLAGGEVHRANFQFTR
jgi:hypothetical protein